MSKYKVFDERPSDESEFVEVEALDIEDAARVYVLENYDSGWSDAFALWVQSESGEAKRVDVSTRTELVVDVTLARSKGGAK